MTESSNTVKSITASVRDVCFYVGPDRQVFSRMKQSPANQIIVVTGGVYRAIVDSPSGVTHLRATAGNVVYWPEGDDHTDLSETGKSLRCIIVWFRWSNPPPGLPFMVRDTGNLIDRLADRLLSLAHDPHYRTELGVESNVFLHAILAEYVSLAKAPVHELRAKVASYIEKHIHEPIHLDELTQAACLEKHHFIRRYKQLTGLTPMQEVRRRKAAYAKHILRLNPARTLDSVARLVGIPHVATLCRLLSRYAGTTARDIRHSAHPEHVKAEYEVTHPPLGRVAGPESRVGGP